MIWKPLWGPNFHSPYPFLLEIHPLHPALPLGRLDGRVPKLQYRFRVKHSVFSVGPQMANNPELLPGNLRGPNSQWCAWILPKPLHFASLETWPPWSGASDREGVPKRGDGHRWPAWQDLDSPGNWPTEQCWVLLLRLQSSAIAHHSVLYSSSLRN